MIMQMLKEAFMSGKKDPSTDDELADDSEGQFKPITTQAELDRIISKRISRYSDYNELKDKVTVAEERALTAETRANAAEEKLSGIEAEKTRGLLIGELASRYDIPEGILNTVSDDSLVAYAEQVAPAYHEHRIKTSLPCVVTEGAYVPDAGIVEDPLRELFLELR